MDTLLDDTAVQPAHTLPTPSPTGAGVKPRRGRPVGWHMPTFCELQDLTLEDFAFLRATAGGMEPKAAFLQFYANRHFDAEGNPIIPHGLTINAHERELLDRLQAAGLAS